MPPVNSRYGNHMKKVLFLVVVAALAYGYIQEHPVSLPGLSSWTQGDDGRIAQAFRNRQSDLQVQGKGVVTRILPDDEAGSRHQRFILRLGNGQTLLVAHNIDLAPRIDGLHTGDSVEFYGEYEWNAKGGVIHWTHHDPAGRHSSGWLRHEGNTYQ
jgi:hypothetical protein